MFHSVKRLTEIHCKETDSLTVRMIKTTDYLNCFGLISARQYNHFLLERGRAQILFYIVLNVTATRQSLWSFYLKKAYVNRVHFVCLRMTATIKQGAYGRASQNTGD